MSSNAQYPPPSSMRRRHSCSARVWNSRRLGIWVSASNLACCSMESVLRRSVTSLSKRALSTRTLRSIGKYSAAPLLSARISASSEPLADATMRVTPWALATSERRSNSSSDANSYSISRKSTDSCSPSISRQRFTSEKCRTSQESRIVSTNGHRFSREPKTSMMGRG